MLDQPNGLLPQWVISAGALVVSRVLCACALCVLLHVYVSVWVVVPLLRKALCCVATLVCMG